MLKNPVRREDSKTKAGAYQHTASPEPAWLWFVAWGPSSVSAE
jgi:hypothetical protein